MKREINSSRIGRALRQQSEAEEGGGAEGEEDEATCIQVGRDMTNNNSRGIKGGGVDAYMSSKNNNMTTAKPTALLPVAAIATLAIITIQFAYAQSELPETIWFGEPDENTDMLLTEVLTQLQQDLQNRSKFNELAMRDYGEIIIYLHNGTEREL